MEKMRFLGWFLLAIMVQTALSTLISIYISCPGRRRQVLRLLNYCHPVRRRKQQRTLLSSPTTRDESPVSGAMGNGIGANALDRRALLAAALKAKRRSSYDVECQTAVILPETFCMICCLAFLFLTSLLPVYGYLSTRNVSGVRVQA